MVGGGVREGRLRQALAKDGLTSRWSTGLRTAWSKGECVPRKQMSDVHDI